MELKQSNRGSIIIEKKWLRQYPCTSFSENLQTYIFMVLIKKKSHFHVYIISGPTSEDWCHFISNSLYKLNQILNNEANTYSILFCHLFSPC